MAAGCAGFTSNGQDNYAAAGAAPTNDVATKLTAACIAASPALTTTPERNHLPAMSVCAQGCDLPAPRQLRRLTPTELNATLQTLFGDANAPQVSSIFSNDPEIYTFQNVAAGLGVDQVGALQVRTMAEAAGTYASAHASALWPSCSDVSVTCETAFVQGFGALALRSPLDANSTADYLALMQSASTFANGVASVTTAMLMSPEFLFRQEIGLPAADGLYDLTPYEVASEISYLIVGSMPDAALFAAAHDSSILEPSVRLAHVARLMQDTRAHAVIDAFFLQWLGVADLPNETRLQGNTTLDPCIATRMVNETTQTIDNVVFAQNGSFADLHATNYSFMDNTLATFYGMSGASGTFGKVGLAGQRDPGILNQGGVLSAASEVSIPSPVLRGRMLREHILCQTLPPPPAGVPTVNSVPVNSTTRAVYLAHVTNATCSSCHALMDPMAFALGSYDTLGRRFASNLENGQAIDTSGTINGLPNSQVVTLTGAADLSAFIAASPQAQACLARNWAMYGLGNVSWLQDGCTFASLSGLAAGKGYNLQGTLAALTQVTSFVRRTQDQ